MRGLATGETDCERHVIAACVAKDVMQSTTTAVMFPVEPNSRSPVTSEFSSMSTTHSGIEMRFEVFEFSGDYWFRLIDHDRELLLSGGPQETLDACLDRISELKVLCPDLVWLHARRSPSGAHYFTVDVDDTILATSPVYSERRDRDATMAFVSQHLVDAPLIVRGMTSAHAPTQAV